MSFIGAYILHQYDLQIKFTTTHNLASLRKKYSNVINKYHLNIFVYS